MLYEQRNTTPFVGASLRSVVSESHHTRQRVGPGPGLASFATTRRSPEQLAALDRVREWTRVRFALSEEAAILVAEVACGLPGCPPVETVVAFWAAGGARHQFKVFKPARDVVEDDLPFAWLKEALVALESMDCYCC
jgi:hypothetical protein